MVKKKLSVLEQYEAKGWLDLVKGKWTSEYRLNAGLQLARDFYQSRLLTVSAIDYSKERVDCSVVNNEPVFVLAARTRYIKAIQSIPKDFYNTVSDVCCFDMLIKGNGNTERQKENDRYMKVCDLCRGLDYLIQFYLKNHIRI